MQNSNKRTTLVIFGATGNLYADKLAKALFLLFQEKTLPKNFRIIAFARKDLDTKDFQSLTKDFILKRGAVDEDDLNQFISLIEYFKGDFSNSDDFINLKNYLALGNDDLVVFHLATANFLYSKIFENIKNAELNNFGGEARIMIEKPFGKDGSDAKYLQNILGNIFTEENIFQIDHYLAKETAQTLSSFSFEENLNILKIKVIFYESNIVGARGASYDKVGAFRDVGENHMLELLSLLVMNKEKQMNIENIRESRAKALENLYIDDTQKITRGQYEKYLSEVGVDISSKTETFFRIFLKSKDSRFVDTVFELEGGKGLADKENEITTTTVSLEIYFENGEKKEFKIQPVPGTVYESYTNVYRNVFLKDQTLFVSIREIMAQWKLADELLEKWKDTPLVVYKIGINGEEIN